MALNILLGCFLNNTKSPGNKITTWNPYWDDVENAKACQKLCQNERADECKYFTYNNDKKTCVLKTDKAFKDKLSTSESVVFGPKVCKGTIKLYITHLKYT